MSQYDAILKFASVAAAKNDPDVQAHYDAINDLFAADRVVQIQAWRNSQDVAGTDADGNPTVTHTSLPGFFILISLPRLVPALRDNAAVQLVIDRDKMNARQSGFVIKSNVSAALLADIRFSPVFAGMDVPWGGLN